jgi:hypothetical protein
MNRKTHKRDQRVAGKMTLRELLNFKHTPDYVPSNEKKDDMALEDENHQGAKLSMSDLTGLKTDVLNTNFDDMMKEIDALLQSSPKNSSLKWIAALDQLYQDFLYRTKHNMSELSPYTGSPVSSQSSLNESPLRKKHRRVTQSNHEESRARALDLRYAWPEQSQHYSPPKVGKSSNKRHTNKQSSNKNKKLTASDITRLTEGNRSVSSIRSSSGFSDKGRLKLSDLNTL